MRDLTLCICELGWLYNKVNEYLKRVFQTGPSSGNISGAVLITESKGLVVQAFGFALQEELHDYYRLLAILEQELVKENNPPLVNTATTTSTPVTGRDREFQSKHGSASENGSTQGNAGLTLLRLKAWMQEPIER